MTGLYGVKPCTRLAGDAEPGVSILRMGERLNRLSPAEARSLGADLILAASTSEAQWDSGRGPAGAETVCRRCSKPLKPGEYPYCDDCLTYHQDGRDPAGGTP